MNPADLVREARRAMEHAHAPYSNYRVGAALLCDDGTVITGCNVENASFGLTNCAERTAVFSAIAVGKTRFSAIAIVASGTPAALPLRSVPPGPRRILRSGFSGACRNRNRNRTDHVRRPAPLHLRLSPRTLRG